MSTSDTNPDFEALLEYIKRSRGFDLLAYKRPGLMRRIQKRMQMLGMESYSDYRDYLEVHPDEFAQLFNTLLINITSFFRDRSSWDYVMNEIIPQITGRKEPQEPIRLWSAGCASGEEAYTLAIALAEVIGLEQFRERVKIYATDLDEEALNQARQATYAAREVGGVPPDLLAKYFEQSDNRYIFRKDLRRSVIFGCHNLIQDPPISRVDLLTCRNTLMYFNAEAQAKILVRFHFALNNGGFLFLGKAEMLLSHTNTFTPVDLKRRVFTKVEKVNMRDRLLLLSHSSEEAVNYLASHARIREAAFDASPVAQVVVALNGSVALANERARKMFGITPKDIGGRLQDLELSYRPVELRSCIEQVYAERRVVNLGEIEWTTTAGELRYLELQVMPLQDTNGNLLGVSVIFTDVSGYKRLQSELEHSNQNIEMAYEELQSTNEELETTNEELQSTVEELETTNEEVQSTNEELETMNEELQSTNEELQTINEEVRRRSEELNEVNAFLESILTSLRRGVVVVNRELQVQVWNSTSEDLWGLRADEVEGQHLLNLDIGLRLEQLIQSIRTCLSGESQYQKVTLPAINRRGKEFQCQVTCTPLVTSGKEIRGVILFIDNENTVNA
jgi:two-component system CheB/CheR fusion protein